MGKTLFVDHSIVSETLSSASGITTARTALPILSCYWLKKGVPGGEYTATQSTSDLHTFTAGTPEKNDFLLFWPASHAVPARLLQDLSELNDGRPEINCYLVSLQANTLAQGLQGSAALFQQLHQLGLWHQTVFAVVVRAGLVSDTTERASLQEMMLTGLLKTQSVWVMQQKSNQPLTTAIKAIDNPVSYRQFMSDYEKLTRLTQFIPERKRFRDIYLRTALMQLMLHECTQQTELSANIRHAISYFGENIPANNRWEKLMLKQPDIFFTLMRVRKKLQPQRQF